MSGHRLQEAGWLEKRVANGEKLVANTAHEIAWIRALETGGKKIAL